ncbi:MAG: hypothetical protein KDA42_08725 [Planctomycetales bacterium]|nr:hypothetical protein [Planctomycetales bacterium]
MCAQVAAIFQFTIGKEADLSRRLLKCDESPKLRPALAALRCLLLCCALSIMATGAFAQDVPPVEMILQPPASNEPVIISSQQANRWREGVYDVWHLRGQISLRQGATLATASEAVLWIEHSATPDETPTKIIAYLEPDAVVRVGARASNSSGATLHESMWFGRFFTSAPLQIRTPDPGGKPGQMPPAYHRAQQQFEPRAAPRGDTAVVPAQFAEPVPTRETMGPTQPGTRRIRAFPRSDARVQARFFPSADGREWVAVIDSGVNLVIDGVERLGVLDIATDRMVIWGKGGEPDLTGNQLQQEGTPLEIYMEGNIVFRQGERVIYADRMYYDVDRRTGIVLDAELLTPAPDYEGLLRLKAAAIRQVDESRFIAYHGLLTSSRIGDPRYSFRSDEIYFQDIQVPAINPFTGMEQMDPATGEPLVEHQRLATSRGNTIYAGNVPIAYWPTLATDLEEPVYYLRSLQLKNDGIFGTQIFTEFDAYQVLGLRNPSAGTDWRLSSDFLSERGPAGGTTFEYDRPDFFGFAGPSFGKLDAWGIYDRDVDNLGRGRKSVTFPDEFRGRVDWRHRHRLPADWTLTAELGFMSDRNFLEQYFEREWDEKKDRTTGIELKHLDANRALSINADYRLNDFFTQTEWLPRADHFWLGESLLFDRLTWFEHSQIGYGRFRTASRPEDARDASMFDLLAWETDPDDGSRVSVAGERLVTRQEVDLPFELGVAKIVPYALGELAHWGEDLNGEDLQRAFGQTGLRASVPMWSVNPNIHSQLWNVHGLAHKVVFDAEFAYADASQNFDQLPLYDQLDDDSTEHFRRRFFFNSFNAMGANVPLRFDERYYALRSGQQGYVTSPVTEIADDLMAVRLGMNHRWQTKRGSPAAPHIVDWIVLDSNLTWFPKEDRDNFGEPLGLFDYNARWHVGDRFALLSDGAFDFFGDGLQMVSVGGILNRPPRGKLYLGYQSIDGPITARVVSTSINYRMSEKWIGTFGTSVDLADTGNIGQRFALTRVGESFLLRVGFHVDSGKDTVGVNFMIEPRFLPRAARSLLSGVEVAPAGAYGLE